MKSSVPKWPANFPEPNQISAVIPRSWYVLDNDGSKKLFSFLAFDASHKEVSHSLDNIHALADPVSKHATRGCLFDPT